MKKFGSLALTLIFAASLMAACTAPTMDETTAPSTAAPTTAPTVATTVPVTIPAPSTDPTGTTGGVNTMDPTASTPGRIGGMGITR